MWHDCDTTVTICCRDLATWPVHRGLCSSAHGHALEMMRFRREAWLKVGMWCWKCWKRLGIWNGICWNMTWTVRRDDEWHQSGNRTRSRVPASCSKTIVGDNRCTFPIFRRTSTISTLYPPRISWISTYSLYVCGNVSRYVIATCYYRDVLSLRDCCRHCGTWQGSKLEDRWSQWALVGLGDPSERTQAETNMKDMERYRKHRHITC